MNSKLALLNSSYCQKLRQWLPVCSWLRGYTRKDFGSDCFAGLITAILLVPQGVAYAMLAGLPAQVGLYASILPPLVYVLTGTSRTMSVGPVSIAAIMIAAALSAPDVARLGDPLGSAIILAAESGLILLLMALFRMGTLVNFISHPVLTGFTSGAALLIVGSQIPALLGLPKLHCGFDWSCYTNSIAGFNPLTTLIGIASLISLVLFDKPLNRLLTGLGLKQTWITGLCKTGPICVVVIGSVYVMLSGHQHQLATVGAIPAGLPALKLPPTHFENWRLLFPSAFFIALIAYVESVAIAKVTARFRKQRIDPNQELIALSGSNLMAALSGGMPVAGGFSRTMVNFNAGAVTQIAMLIAALLLAVVVTLFTDGFAHILKTSLAAIILVAITPLIKLRSILQVWQFDKADAIAEISTFGGVLLFGIEQGLGIGIAVTLLGYLWRTSQPHIAVVGEIPETQHFRNIKRHQVETWPNLLLIRVDENMTFANAGYLEDFVDCEIEQYPYLQHVVLIFTSVSYIDSTALETLENLIDSLAKNRITLHFAEVKGPVMDRLQATLLLSKLQPGQVFFTTHEAAQALSQREPVKPEIE
ncbi:MAG: STAS domain-containing protein [Gammaproteobacteria bacterium]|nr:STAS domain-containing protein [Gammaproteobacteria bacterium]